MPSFTLGPWDFALCSLTIPCLVSLMQAPLSPINFYSFHWQTLTMWFVFHIQGLCTPLWLWFMLAQTIDRKYMEAFEFGQIRLFVIQFSFSHWYFYCLFCWTLILGTTMCSCGNTCTKNCKCCCKGLWGTICNPRKFFWMFPSTPYLETRTKVKHSPRLDHQPLFGQWAHAPPRLFLGKNKDWTRESGRNRAWHSPGYKNIVIHVSRGQWRTHATL